MIGWLEMPWRVHGHTPLTLNNIQWLSFHILLSGRHEICLVHGMVLEDKAVTRLHPAFANHKALCPTKQVLIYDCNRFDLITPYMLIRCEKHDHRKTEDKNNDFKLCIRIRSKLPYDSNSFSWLIKWVYETIAALTSKWWWLKFLSIIRTMLKGCFWFRQGLGFEEGRNPKLFEVHVDTGWFLQQKKWHNC